MNLNTERALNYATRGGRYIGSVLNCMRTEQAKH